MIQHRYPIGPLSLVQMESAAATKRYQIIHGWIAPEKDTYLVGMESQVERGVYPTFGHIDGSHRRWYRDEWNRVGEFAIPV
jgi:hypothetical protein